MIKLTKEFWTRAYQTNIGKLKGICYRYTGNDQLSEDLAHDAFLKAIEKAHSFRGEGDFDAWLRRIVVNQVLQYLRDQKKQPYLHQLSGEQAEVLTTQENTSSTRSMEFAISELLETISQLPDHHRLVFNLYVLEKFTHSQIGEELGISEGTSKSHLSRARKKLQQLLTQKAEPQKEKENKERAGFLLLALTDDTKTDQIFQQSLDQFSIPPKNPLSLEFSQFAGKSFLEKMIPKKPIQIIGAFSAVVTITWVSLFISNRHQGNKLNDMTSITTLTTKDSTAPEKNNENILLQAATISQDSINKGRNKKQNSMKALDSLALMLALSATTVNAPSFKDSIKNQIEKQHVEISVSMDSNLLRGHSAPAVIASMEERGTFHATEIYWNKDNLSVDFKGDVRVSFKNQNFTGRGTFNFLGKVHLLIVDGEQVAMGKTIRLSNQDYNLTVLDSKEGISKYGDAGKNGAVVIELSK